MKIKPHPARKSRIFTTLASIAVLLTSVESMHVNTQNAQSSEISPTVEPSVTESPSVSPTKVKSATPAPSVTVSKLKTKKKKVHTTSGASKKK